MKKNSVSMRKLSPLRNTTQADNAAALAEEQLAHFGIDADSDFGKTLLRITDRMYETNSDLEQLWSHTIDSMNGLDRADRIAWFNAKKFLSFQLAKLLDTLQHSFRRSYQSLNYSNYDNSNHW